MELQEGEKVGTHLEFPAYRVTDKGRVIGKNGRVLVPRVNEDGYVFVLIKDGEGLVRHAYLHQLVTEVFGPQCPEGYKWGDRLHVLVHKNGDKSDNRMENFEWFKTEVAPMQGAKLDKLQNDAVVAAAVNVGKIVEACRAGRLQKDVATEFGVSQAAVSAIARAAGIIRRRQLTGEQVAKVHALKAAGKSYTEIAREVGCSLQVAYLVGTGRRRGLKMAAVVGCSRQEDSFPKP
jgi:hypothetical protein